MSSSLSDSFQALRVFKRAAGRFYDLCRTHGFASAAKRVYRKLTNTLSASVAPPPKFEKGMMDVELFGTAPQAGDARTARVVTFFIPDIGLGSGGHLNIFRFCAELERQGYEIHFVLFEGSMIPTEAEAVKIINDFFVKFESAHVHFNYRDAPTSHVAFASSWHSAYYVKKFIGAVHKLYFVQDFEPFFYPAGSHYYLAEQTYRWGFKAITAGQWLTDKLTADFGCEARPFGFSYEKHLYAAAPRAEAKPLRIFFYARPATPRRVFELGARVLETVKRTYGDRVEIVLAGEKIDPSWIAVEFVNLGIVPLGALGALYNTCEIAIVFSATNLSLLPLELMACGCVVVSNKGPHAEWLLNDRNAVLVNWDLDEIVAEIGSLIDSPGRRAKIRQSALAFAESTSWTEEYGKAVRHMKDLVDASSVPHPR